MSHIDRGALEAAIGPRADYYLRQFERIDHGRSAATWNWPAFFLSTAWFDYRGLTAYAALNFVGPWMALILMVFLRGVDPVLATIVPFAYLVTVFILVPLYANALYYRRLKKQFARATKPEERPSPPTIGRRISAGVAGAGTILSVVVFAAVVPTAFNGYMPRAQVSEAIALMHGAKTPVAEYYADERKWPDDIRKVAGNTSGKYTERLEITSGAGAASGRLVITATMKTVGVNSSVAGKSVQLTTEDGKSWVCRRGAVNGVDDKYLPASCR